VNASEPKSIDIPVPSRTSDIENDVGYITANALPTKTSDLTNDSGFITLAQVPTPSYIEDATGNQISANLSCTYIDNTAWEITDPSSNKYVLEYVGFIQSYHTWECVEPENIKLVLTYSNDWELQVYTWQEIGPGGDHDWVLDINGSYNGDSDITTIPYFVNAQTTCNYSAQRPVTKHLTLATKDELPTKVSELDNDVGYITASEVVIPSNLSDYNNDVGFITASAIPSNVGAFTNDVGYLTASSSAFMAKRDKSDLVYKVGFDKNNLDKVVKFVVEYVDGNNQNVTATLDKYDEFTQTWTGDNTNWKVYTYLVGMEGELYFALDDGTSGRDAQPAPSQGAEDTSWNFIYNSNPATWTMVMTQNIALQQDFKNLRDMKDISYPASVDSTGMYTIQKFNVSGTEVAHFTTSGSTSTWDTNDSSVNIYEISTTDGTNFTLVSGGIQIGTFTMTNLKNGVVDLTYDGNNYTVGATFKQTTFALKDYVDAQIGSVLNEQF